MRVSRLLIVVLVALMWRPVGAAAQTVDLDGRVVDAQGGGVGGAVVRITPASGGSVALMAVTAADGRFQVAGLLPGRVIVQVDRGGFRRLVQPLTVSDDSPHPHVHARSGRRRRGGRRHRGRNSAGAARNVESDVDIRASGHACAPADFRGGRRADRAGRSGPRQRRSGPTRQHSHPRASPGSVGCARRWISRARRRVHAGGRDRVLLQSERDGGRPRRGSAWLGVVALRHECRRRRRQSCDAGRRWSTRR